MPGLLPLRPRPIQGELFSSWMMRLAHANVERLTYLTAWVGGDRSFWTHDPDRWLRSDVAQGLHEATGVPLEEIESMPLRSFEGRLFPPLAPRATIRWVMPLGKALRASYQHSRAGLSCCPVCLAEQPFLRREWRLSFVTCCERHGTQLLDACPQCGSPYAPLTNDLGRGRTWVGERELPFAWCPECGSDLREAVIQPAAPGLLAFQARLLEALESGTMLWPCLGEVPALEGFDVLHQLLSVLMLPEVQRGMVSASGLPGPQRQPERRNRSFEDFGQADRRLLMGQLAWLIEEWPGRFVGLMKLQGVTRRPLVYNMAPIPDWYDEVAEELSLRNGKRPLKVVHLEPHLTAAQMRGRRDTASSVRERLRWDILCGVVETPHLLAVARRLGVSDQQVRNVVRRYNEGGPEAMADPRQGRPLMKKRLLTLEQEAELQAWMAQGRPSNAELAAWMAERCGKTPDATSLWIYRRGCESHSREGRKASVMV